MKKPAIFAIAIFIHLGLFAQPDSACTLRISLLTCTPGVELYSTFGHSALRVQDLENHTDLVFNYGTFDFNDPDFYSKFVRGKLLYFVSVDTLDSFLYEYQYDRRGVTEQVLNLDCTEKRQLLAALQDNAREENKYYKYDFISDNCTTRLRDIVFQNTGKIIFTRDILAHEKVSFRNLIHEYLNASHKYWSELGIDILLGSPLDRSVSNKEAMFLPDYLMKGFDSTMISDKKMVMDKKDLLKAGMEKNEKPLFTPFLCLTIVFLLVATMSILRPRARWLHIFDFALFFITGVLGMLILFMWLGTDHPECKNNFNLAWALPAHFIIVFFIYSKATWVRKYFLIYSVLLVLLLISWFWLPQEMNIALLPVVLLLLWRSYFRAKIRNSHD